MEQAEPQSYGKAGWLSYISFSWVTPVLEKGLNRQICSADCPQLAEQEDVVMNSHKLLDRLALEERERKDHPLLRAVYHAYYAELMLLQVVAIVGHLLGLLNPLLLKQVLVFQEGQNDETLNQNKIRIGFAAVSALILQGLFMIFWNTQVAFYQERVWLRIGSALRGTVLQRCLLSRTGGRSSPADNGADANDSQGSPAAYNVISFDVGPNIDIIKIILGLWLFPFQFFSTLAVLYSQVQWAIVPGLVTILVAKTIVGLFLCQDGLLRHRVLEAKDLRLGYCSEGFSNIRALQMLGWVRPFQERIMGARHEELRLRSLRLWMQKLTNALDYSLSALVTLATLTYYVHSGGELKASIVLPVIALVTGLAAPFGQFPLWLNQYLIWRSAYARVNNFIGVSAYAKRRSENTAADTASSGAASSPQMPDSSPGSRPQASFDNCALSWSGGAEPEGTSNEHQCVEADEKDPESLLTPLLPGMEQVFTLRNLDLQVHSRELLVLLGEAGQGKSSVLHGLLGEMKVESGSMRSPATERHTGGHFLPQDMDAARAIADQGAEEDATSQGLRAENAMPFATQTPTIFSGSLRFNILFGAPYRPGLYDQVLKACALAKDFAALPGEDLTELGQGGATLSGGQKARVSLARAVYRAALDTQEGRCAPVVLLDDPFCSLDRGVAREICQGLFAVPGGLLTASAVVVATADPWWLQEISGHPGAGSVPRVAVLRAGQVVATGTTKQLAEMNLPELRACSPGLGPQDGDHHRSFGGQASSAPAAVEWNPQEDEQPPLEMHLPEKAKKATDSHTQTPPTEKQKQAMRLLQQEHREEGHVKRSTYMAYFNSVGASTLYCTAVTLIGIMVFEALSSLWITYMTEDHKDKNFIYTWLLGLTKSPPTQVQQLLYIYACLVFAFLFFNIAGNVMEVLGGVSAARRTFSDGLEGALARPFRWWDANPTGRVLNRFSEDVEVVDAAVTGIMGVIFGAVLYFIGRTFVLLLSNPTILCFLPLIACGLEYYARFYRKNIREIQRLLLVSMSTLYQDMAETIAGKVLVRAYASESFAMCRSMGSLDGVQKLSFFKVSVQQWLSFRMSMVGYTLSVLAQLRPILQFYGAIASTSAALVGFSIAYSSQTVMIIQQFINNYSDLEMQLISIERLREYAQLCPSSPPSLQLPQQSHGSPTAVRGLYLQNIEVLYREGLPPALSGVTLDFDAGEATAIIGRTGAGKTSLLLAVLQLVPYTGTIVVDGECLAQVPPDEARQRLVGAVPQSPVVFAGSLRWNLDPQGFWNDQQLWAALRAVGLESVVRGEGQDLDAKVTGSCEDTPGRTAGKLSFSQGQQQLLCAARVVLRKPRAVMLDEITASLPSDIAMAITSTLLKRFKEDDATVLMITHQEAVAELCDRAVTIADGRVVHDTRPLAVRS